MDSNMPIAIIGMSCRFAGDVDSPSKLWDLLAEGKSAWSEIPKDRFNIDGFHHPNFEKLNGTNVIGGHFMKEDIGLFDAHFFNLSAETAAALDPQFRLQLESTYEALESAGITLQNVAGSNTSVYAGSFFRDYHESLIRDPETLPRFLLMGTGAAMASNRLSHFFDLRGPSMSVDTGCSTTLTALHQACQSLRSGESTMSIVGGANLMFNPDMFLAMSSMTLISKDGRSWAFDSRANGYGRGEGSATVILKPLDAALRDGDPIRAIIRDSGINQDGKTETITTPSGEAQEALIRACYERAGLDPGHTTYFEAHGTGTPTGDPIEVGAIASVFKDSRKGDSSDLLRIGSVKTNIGHTETASGVAAIIKVALALEKGQIPPSVNFDKPNAKLSLDEWKLKVPTELEEWVGKDGIRRASINNFGYGGSNAHVIMEDYSSYVATTQRPKLLTHGGPNNGFTAGHHHADSGIVIDDDDAAHAQNAEQSRVFLLSAKDEKATERMITNLKTYLQDQKSKKLTIAEENALLSSLAHTLCSRRTLFQWTATFSGSSLSSLIHTLDSGRVKPVKSSSSSAGSPLRIGYVFTGQGAQWWAMGKELIAAYPVFKSALEKCDAELHALGATWTLAEELSRDAETSNVNKLDYSTPVCVAVQIALVELLKSWGIVPQAVCSHSSGEIAAAYAAGALSLSSAMAIAFARGGLASEGNRQFARRGGMMAVGLGRAEGERYLPMVTKGQVVVACENSPTSITLSGDVEGLMELEEVFKTENIFARRLKVDAAWHSHHMEAVADAYYASMDKKVKPAKEKLDMIFSSPCTGKRMDKVAEIGSPGHWVRSLTGCVKFVDAFRSMVFATPGSTEPEVDMVIEVGPHAALSGPIQDILAMPEFKDIPTKIPYASCLIRKKSAVETMQELVGNLVGKGYPVDLKGVNFPFGSEGVKVLTDLPAYPWNHSTKHWIEPRFNRALRQRSEAPHDLLGSLVLGCDPNAPTWRHIVRLGDLPWVKDHVVQGNMIYPAAGYIAMAVEGMKRFAARQSSGEKKVAGYQLRDVDILNALVVPETSEGIEMQLSLRPGSERDLSTKGWTEFVVQSVTLDNKWTEHCKGLISVVFGPAAPKFGVNQPTADSHYRSRINPNDIWSGMRSGGINHGPIFRNMKSIRCRAKQSVTTFTVADTKAVMPKQHEMDHVIHPTTLDSVFQAAYTAAPGAGGKNQTPKVPRSISKLWIAHDISRTAGHDFKAYANLDHADDQTTKTALRVVDADATEPVISIDGFICQSIGSSPSSSPEDAYEAEKFTTTHWAPDVTFLKDAFLKKQLGSQISPEEAETLMDLRKACMFYIYDALRDLTPEDLKKLEWYHKKFYIWMRLQADLARANSLAPDSSKWANATLNEKATLLEKVRASSTNGEMVYRLGPQIVPILRGEITALEVMLENNLLSRYYLEGLKWGRANAKLGEMVRHYVHKNPHAKMIEIGGGTGGATAHVLNAIGTSADGLGPRAASYDFTDVSSGFFEAAKTKFDPWKDLMRFKKLNIESPPSAQGFEEGTYDVVIACQVLHATKSMDNTMRNVRSLLKPGGKLFMVETTQDQMDVQFVFGFLSGWWLSEEEERKFSPSLSVPMWDRVLHRTGFRNGVEAEVRDVEDEGLYAFSVMAATAAPERGPEYEFDITFVTGGQVPDVWLDKLRVSIGLVTCSVPNVKTLEEVAESVDGNEVVVFLDDPKSPVLAEPSKSQFGGIRAMCTRSKGLLWLTQGAHGSSEQPLASLAAGFLRSLRQEYSGKRLGTLDLDPSSGDMWSESSITTITEVFRKLFDYSINETGSDYEFAEREGTVQIPRYIKDVKRNAAVFKTQSATDAQPEEEMQPFIQPDRPLRLTIGTPGLLDTLKFVDDTSAASDPLPEDFVEVEPRAFGVNFRDVMVAMGQLKSSTMGYDCAGIITRVGPAAASEGYVVGDRVSVLLRGHYASRCRIHWSSAVKIPDSMSFETAASLPTQYVAAYVSLYDTARLQKGETVLIHAATGGVGQAAVMMAQRVGAEVFVTVGTDEKREFVQKHYGISPDHIFSSRDVSFAAGIMAATKGRGVDVVLNSLAGSLLQESFNCLAPFGRFVEIGKRDLEQNSSLAMEAFTRAVSYTSIDVITYGEHKKAETNRIMKDIIRLVGNRELKTVEPITVYPVGEVQKAFRLMQAGKHMGKIVLSSGPETLVPVVPRTAATTEGVSLRADASYLVVGGFGGLGRSICSWLALQGAKHLVVVSRNAKADKLAQLQTELNHVAKGVKVTAVSCDISNMAVLTKALDCVGRGVPPIRGVIHGGMELRDSVLEHMKVDDHKGALAPKVSGSWNLHQYFQSITDNKKGLDFFVMLSSLVGIVGFASQSNYSAGGTFQDSLAAYRVSQGLPGVSLDLPVVKSVGYLADHPDSEKTIDSLKRHGFTALTEEEVLAAIGSAISTPFAGQLTLGLNTGPTGQPNSDAPLSRDARFTQLKHRAAKSSSSPTSTSGSSSSDLSSLLSSSTTLEQATQHTLSAITKKLQDIFMIADASEINPDLSPAEFGVDSLVAVELRNMISMKAGGEMSIFEIMQCGSLRGLAGVVVRKSGYVDGGLKE
ncbi:putative polyketide synthase [Sordaria brevicollis]|uniref:Polyketide synthase n=1 Tax=Sordaria brevicollis TaxID=83679 RepID=A0AAE0UD15_SORBR|nr:putative polyketide synthase [Sordaria brevicollis]